MIGDKGKLEVVDNSIHHKEVAKEGDDRYRAAHLGQIKGSTS